MAGQSDKGGGQQLELQARKGAKLEQNKVSTVETWVGRVTEAEGTAWESGRTCTIREPRAKLCAMEGSDGDLVLGHP